MNQTILRLFGLVGLLFAVLVAFTSRWTVFEASSLRANPLNRRGLLEEQRIHRGRILAADGTVLARSTRASGGIYNRSYPNGGLFAHAIGYSYITIGRAGLELSRNDALSGQRGTVSSILDQLQGKTRQGDDVITTLNPNRPRAALSALSGQRGRSWRSTHARARSRSWPPHRAMTPARPVAEPLHGAERRQHPEAPDQPRDPVRLRPGLDLQGGHRHRGDRQRRVHPPVGRQRQERRRDLRRAAVQRLQPGLRADRPDDRPAAVGQHGLGPGGRAGSARTSWPAT